jgi:predicted nucleic acid-binding protein
MKALVDASTLLIIVKHADATKLAEVAADLTTLDLAAYEAGNGLWKQVRLLKLMSEEEAHTTHDALAGLLSRTSIVRMEELDHVKAMDLALKSDVAYYDACYVIAAESLRLPLATEDRKLARSMAGRREGVVGWTQLFDDDDCPRTLSLPIACVGQPDD